MGCEVAVDSIKPTPPDKHDKKKKIQDLPSK